MFSLPTTCCLIELFLSRYEQVRFKSTSQFQKMASLTQNLMRMPASSFCTCTATNICPDSNHDPVWGFLIPVVIAFIVGALFGCLHGCLYGERSILKTLRKVPVNELRKKFAELCQKENPFIVNLEFCVDQKDVVARDGKFRRLRPASGRMSEESPPAYAEAVDSGKSR